MIVDMVENIKAYGALGANFKTAVEYIAKTDLLSLPPGRIEIDGERVYAIVTEKQLTSRPTAWEAHRLYADIQIVTDGSETIGYFPLSMLKTEIEFPADKDAVLLTNLPGLDVPIGKGQFFIALPQDVHLPNCPGRDGTYSKKVIVKVRL